MIALRSFVGVRENARRFGVALPAGSTSGSRARCAFARPLPPPRRRDPGALGRRHRRLPELLALRRRAARAARRARARASPTAATTCSAAAGTPDARFLIFDCGPLGDGGHGHYDLLSVEVFAGGRPLVVDPGRCTYSEGPPNLRRWFRGTAAHNTVCVDGLDQTPYTRTRPPGPVAEGRFLGRATAPGLDVLAGEARSPAYDAVHQPPDHVRRRRALGDRGPAARASARTATTCASTSRPMRSARRASTATPSSRPALTLRDRRRAADRARARLGRAALRRAPRRRRWSAPSPTGARATRRLATRGRYAAMTLARDPRRPAARRAARRRRRWRAALGAGALRAHHTRSTASARACASSTALDARRITSPARTFRGRAPSAYRRAAAPRRGPGAAASCTRASWARCSGRSPTTAGSPRCRCCRPSAALDALVGRAGRRARGSSPTRPSASATAACLDAAGRVLAYAKVHAGDGAARERARRRGRRRRARHRRPAPARAARARPLAPDGALALEPLAGRRLDTLPAGELGAGAARARRRPGHAARAPPAAGAALRPPRPGAARARGRRDRPRAARRRARRRRAARRAARPPRRRGRPAPSACTATRTCATRCSTATASALIDLEDAAAGPAAADLGHVLAGLLCARVRARSAPPSAALARRAAARLRGGRAAAAAEALRWHTAASVLARRALPAVSRVRAGGLRRLAACCSRAEAAA